uniref:Uncharacterized protein n=1 Tax=Hyaloperonospora arabidopsidis (strain Emoy2) TaxID=559515 RepID=M4C5P5_HYAAE
MVNIPLMFMEVGGVGRGYLDRYPRLWEVPRSKPEIVGSTWIDTGDCGRYLGSKLESVGRSKPEIVGSTWIDTGDCGRYLDPNLRVWEVLESIPEIVGGTWIKTRDCGRYLDQNPRLWVVLDQYPRLYEVPGSKLESVGGT